MYLWQIQELRAALRRNRPECPIFFNQNHHWVLENSIITGPSRHHIISVSFIKKHIVEPILSYPNLYLNHLIAYLNAFKNQGYQPSAGWHFNDPIEQWNGNQIYSALIWNPGNWFTGPNPNDRIDDPNHLLSSDDLFRNPNLIHQAVRGNDTGPLLTQDNEGFEWDVMGPLQSNATHSERMNLLLSVTLCRNRMDMLPEAIGAYTNLLNFSNLVGVFIQSVELVDEVRRAYSAPRVRGQGPNIFSGGCLKGYMLIALRDH